MEALAEILSRFDRLEKCVNNIYSKWLTVNEASIYCRISESKMRKLIGAGEVPINHIGGKILINRKALDYFVMFGTGKPTRKQRESVQCLL